MDNLLKALSERSFAVSPKFNGDYQRFERNGKVVAGWFRGVELKDVHGEVFHRFADYGDHVTKERYRWQAGKDTSDMSSAEVEALSSAIRAATAAAASEKLQRQALAAQTAAQIYDSASAAGAEEHPYIVRKQIRPGTLLRRVDEKLCIPVFIAGEVASLQFIDEIGGKRFLTGGRLDRGYTWWLPGGDVDLGQEVLHVAEGYATAASIGMALGVPVLVSFNTGNLEKIAAIIASLPFQPKTVVICADNDNKSPGVNPGMHSARAARSALIASGVSCRIVAPPAAEGTSCDWNDFHCSFGLERLREALTGGAKGEENTKMPPHTHTAQLPAIVDFSQAPIHLTDKGKPIPPTQKQVVDILADTFGDHLMRDGKDVFLRGAKHWIELDQLTFKYHITQAGMWILRGQANERQLNDIYKLLLAYLPSVPPGQSFYRQDPRLSNFQDGTQEIVPDGSKFKLVFREHRPGDLLTWVLPYSYAEARGSNELFTSWLLRCFDGDPDANGKIRALKQIGGACLASLFPRYVFLFGPGGTGKSTFAKLCMRFLSPQNVCSVEPRHQGERFGTEIMVNKLANIVTDISGAKIDSALFKRAEDRVPEYIDRKGRGAVMGYLPGLNIFCTNILPKGIDGESSAMDRRATIIEFAQSMTVGGYSRDYDLTLLNAGPGAILKFFLEGLEDLCESGGIYFNPESGAARLQAWKDSESMTAQFLDAVAHGEIEGVVIDPGAKLERKIVGSALTTWVGRPLPKQALGHIFSDLHDRGYRVAGVNGTKYVHGLGSEESSGSTRF